MAKARRTKEPEQPFADPVGNASTSETAAGQIDEHDDRYSPERIAARAYELYLARGGSHGQDWDDWLAAERELASAATPRRDRSE